MGVAGKCSKAKGSWNGMAAVSSQAEARYDTTPLQKGFQDNAKAIDAWARTH